MIKQEIFKMKELLYGMTIYKDKIIVVENKDIGYVEYDYQLKQKEKGMRYYQFHIINENVIKCRAQDKKTIVDDNFKWHHRRYLYLLYRLGELVKFYFDMLEKYNILSKFIGINIDRFCEFDSCSILFSDYSINFEGLIFCDNNIESYDFPKIYYESYGRQEYCLPKKLTNEQAFSVAISSPFIHIMGTHIKDRDCENDRIDRSNELFLKGTF
ncbi:hypothetical protein L3V82_11895 [Thiotrichales bacterium 19S3-7]|nr:hypothetical protein [Thiotrichales bacterium 19S3-7]MCF6802796.1 hypothetical protein [Thiotrichales bacterium 19S3-11]